MKIPANGIYFLMPLIGALCISSTKAFHDMVNVKIKNGKEIIELKWKRTEQLLANRNLPVWYATRNRAPYLVPQVFKKMGEFIMYHDVEKSSAVVYFPKIKCFYGVVDTRFYVKELRVNFDEPDRIYDVGGPHILARAENDEFFHNCPNLPLSDLFTPDQINYISSLIDSETEGNLVPVPLSRFSHQNQNGNGESSCLPIKKHNGENRIVHHNHAVNRPLPSKILYPEILVFITHDVFTTFRGMNEKNGISLLLLYYLTYFNAIDMLFAKLTTDDVTIHINIAGFVIETEQHVFPYSIHQYRQPGSQTIFHRLHAEESLHSFPSYIHQHGDIFVEDSFDFFFISTGHEMGRGTLFTHGMSSPPVDVYGLRALRVPYKSLSGSIVHRKGALSDYVIATRQIAQLMNFRVETSSSRESGNNAIACHAIMHRGRTHCLSCLKWSKNSHKELTEYVRSNLNHCFLLNYPRSLHPYGHAVASLQPEDQCSCYGYRIDTMDPFYMMRIPKENCDKPMRCSNNQDLRRQTPLPLDGTPCGDRNMVCWRQKCVANGVSQNGDNSYEGPTKMKRIRLGGGRLQ